MQIYKQAEALALFNENQRLRAATGQPLRPPHHGPFCTQKEILQIADENAKIQRPEYDLNLLGMAESRVAEIDQDIQRNPSKYPGKNPLATAVLKEGLATIKREQAAAPAKRPVAAPAKLTHAARMAKMAPAEKTAYFRANEAGIRAETFKK